MSVETLSFILRNIVIKSLRKVYESLDPVDDYEVNLLHRIESLLEFLELLWYLPYSKPYSLELTPESESKVVSEFLKDLYGFLTLNVQKSIKYDIEVVLRFYMTETAYQEWKNEH